jgi:hypothetical protein
VVVGQHAFYPLTEFAAPAVVHQLGKGADVFGGSVEGWAAGDPTGH